VRIRKTQAVEATGVEPSPRTTAALVTYGIEMDADGIPSGMHNICDWLFGAAAGEPSDPIPHK